MKAVFLDRDGTINVEMPDYLTDLKKLRIIQSAYKAIGLLNQYRFKTIIVTNQSCVRRGLLEEKELHRIHEKLEKRLALQGARLDSIYYCPHIPDDGCDCRKPKTGLLKRAVADHGIDLKKSFLVGDRFFDIDTGKRGGCKTVLVLTGAGEKTWADLKTKSVQEQPDYVATDILQAAQWIIRQPHAV